MTKFNIGDTAWRAHAGLDHIWITCPECLGSGRLRVILGDESEVSIACECCSRGYEGSLGKMQTYAFRSAPESVVITGVEITKHGEDSGCRVQYKVGCWSVPDQDLFATRDEAMIRAATLVAEHEAEEKKRLGSKERQHKTWAWHVRYWRSQIRHAKEQIERAEAQLAMAPKNVKGVDNV